MTYLMAFGSNLNVLSAQRGKATWTVKSDLWGGFHFAHKSNWLLLFNEFNEHKETDVIDLTKQMNWKSRKWSE